MVATSAGNLPQCVKTSASDFACVNAEMSDIHIAIRLKMPQ